MEFPPHLRPAVAADIDRMAEVAVAGFNATPRFLSERPRYKEFQEDTIASFANTFRAQLLDPRMVVIVAEDSPRPDEGTVGSSSADPRIIAGVASWRFPEGSPRYGQFVEQDVGVPRTALNRDLNQQRADIYSRILEETEKEHFTGIVICDKLIVHPSYRRRGHARSMLKWGQRLCDQDGIDQGVIPSKMSEPVYASLGYKTIGEMNIPGDSEVQGFTQKVTMYSAQKR
ncbi:acyl-CoA N-acyltransferase [Nemania sp. FL0031]|nr:acyl-CoA N-acyltransferase [Nemania sp. FL0031]